MKTKAKIQFKSKLNNVEIEGLEKMFSDFYNDYLGIDEMPQNYGFFMSNDTLCSEDMANGYPLEFEGFKVNHLEMGINGLTYIVCINDEDQYIIFEFNKYNTEFYLID